MKRVQTPERSSVYEYSRRRKSSLIGTSYCRAAVANPFSSSSSWFGLLAHSKTARVGLAIAVVVGMLISKFGVQQILWPKTGSDARFKEPLPPGSLGCPFVGNNILQGSKRQGPELFYSKNSKKLGHPRVWKFYFLNFPVASVSGKEQVTRVQNQEFVGSDQQDDDKPTTLFTDNEATIEYVDEGILAKILWKRNKNKKKKTKVFSTDNVLFEPDKAKHLFLRKLVGQAMTSSAVAKSVPVLQQLADDVVDKMISSPHVTMHDMSVEYTLEKTQRQLLGLGLQGEERERFLRELKIWLDGLFFRKPSFNPFRPSPALRARIFIESVIEDKIKSLERNGPDGSTLSEMVFATHEEDPSKKLTMEQVIENALVLISAGSETTAGSLTYATLALGLHPHTYKTLVEEQRGVQARLGDKMESSHLSEEESPYLNAVVKESLRLGAVSGGFPRKTKETFVLDGKQIPKGWYMFGNIRLTHELDPVSYKEDGSHMNIKTGFVPERWLDEETTPVDYIPFGAGPRYCLGATLALAEMKVFLAVLARRAEYELVDQGDISWNKQTIIPRPEDGVQLKVRADTLEALGKVEMADIPVIDERVTVATNSSRALAP